MRAAILVLALYLSTCGSTMPALAQHNHDAGHNDYQSWASGRTGNCCTGEHCGALNADEWRLTVTGTEVKIDGQWCPVLREHFLIRGKSPDWNTPHACIGKGEFWKDRSACERLLCFTGKGGF